MDDWPRPRLRSFSHSEDHAAHSFDELPRRVLAAHRSATALTPQFAGPRQVGRSVSFRHPQPDRNQPVHNAINNPYQQHRKLSKREAALAARRKRYSVEALDFSHLDTKDLSTFLRHIRLHKYTELLEQANITFEQLLAIDDEGLVRAGISAVGARTRLLKAIERYNEFADIRRNGLHSRPAISSMHANQHRHAPHSEYTSSVHGTPPRHHYVDSLETSRPRFAKHMLTSHSFDNSYSTSAPSLYTSFPTPSWTNSSFSTDSDDEDFDYSDEDDGADLLSHVAEAAEQLLLNMVETEPNAHHSQILASFEKLSVTEHALHGQGMAPQSNNYVHLKSQQGYGREGAHLQWPPSLLQQYGRRRTNSANSQAVWTGSSDYWNSGVSSLRRRELNHMPAL